MNPLITAEQQAEIKTRADELLVRFKPYIDCEHNSLNHLRLVLSPAVLDIFSDVLLRDEAILNKDEDGEYVCNRLYGERRGESVVSQEARQVVNDLLEKIQESRLTISRDNVE